jgi:hypothetical protein
MRLMALLRPCRAQVGRITVAISPIQDASKRHNLKLLFCLPICRAVDTLWWTFAGGKSADRRVVYLNKRDKKHCPQADNLHLIEEWCLRHLRWLTMSMWSANIRHLMTEENSLLLYLINDSHMASPRPLDDRNQTKTKSCSGFVVFGSDDKCRGAATQWCHSCYIVKSFTHWETSLENFGEFRQPNENEKFSFTTNHQVVIGQCRQFSAVLLCEMNYLQWKRGVFNDLKRWRLTEEKSSTHVCSDNTVFVMFAMTDIFSLEHARWSHTSLQQRFLWPNNIFCMIVWCACAKEHNNSRHILPTAPVRGVLDTSCARVRSVVMWENNKHER